MSVGPGLLINKKTTMRPFLHNLVGQFIIVSMTEALVVISGKVQRIFFRASTQKKAI